ncbi:MULTISPECIES: hypothetical protein [Agrobacterium]|uniref:hypothetical protein n=1 Tax=Agrobacterium TaxID=357 RepID=UPI0022B8495A|nr:MULTISPECIES: hypothetical protein [Agrobacterium]MCZ7887149.1 hypothetical protein [Agrobacterium salinitolerans]MDA5631094.1 hypothetical protein [Agrobacterium sp. ST15.16.055]MDA6980359.1 hypothetical protein [Agrobacterium salinitolerans]
MRDLSPEKKQTVAFALMALFHRDQNDEFKREEEKISTDRIASIAHDLGIPAKILAGAYFVEGCASPSDGSDVVDLFDKAVLDACGDEYAMEFVSEVSGFIQRVRESIGRK